MKTSLPQDFPDHLRIDAPCEPVAAVSPIGSGQLLIDHLSPDMFEQFCWWLLTKDHDISGCQLMGMSGRAQGGIDLFSRDIHQDGRLVVFECKRRSKRKLTPRGLEELIENFMRGEWRCRTSRFVLILAQTDVANIAGVWSDSVHRLRGFGVDAEMWTALDLTNKVRLYPDILTRFFPHEPVSKFCNDWMQRVAFTELLQKAITDPRSRVRDAAQHFLSAQQLGANQLVQIQQTSNSLQIDDPWLSMYALLPITQLPIGSAALTLKTPSASGVTIVLNQKWLLQNMLGCVGLPATPEFRRFLVGTPVPGSSEHVVDLVSARVTLGQNAVTSLTNAADKLTHAYEKALSALDAEWGTAGFPFVHGNNLQVAIARIPAWLCQAILEFSREYDVAHGNSEWHIFDFGGRVLKPYTVREHPLFDTGYHAMLYFDDTLEDLSGDGEMAILWTPPSTPFQEKISPRKWWSAEFTRNWLKHDLLPKVGEWLNQRRTTKDRIVGFFGKNLRPTNIHPEDGSNLHELQYSFVEPKLSSPTENLVGAIEQLQSFYNARGHHGQYGISPEEQRNLYRSLTVLLQGKRGYIGYIAGKLQLPRDVTSHDAAIAALQALIDAPDTSLQDHDLDGILRASLEAIDDDASWLSSTAQRQIRVALVPLAKHCDRHHLYEYRSRWM